MRFKPFSLLQKTFCNQKSQIKEKGLTIEADDDRYHSTWMDYSNVRTFPGCCRCSRTQYLDLVGGDRGHRSG